MKIITLAILLASMHVTNGVAVQAQVTGPLSFSASLSGSRISLGEPFTLDYTLANISENNIEPNWKGEHTSFSIGRIEFLPQWMSIRVMTPDGKSLPAQADLRYRHGGVVVDGGGGSPPLVLGSKQGRSGHVVLSRWFFPQEPGRYRIVVEPNLPYKSPITGQQVFTGSYSFDLTVLPQEAIKLRNTAAKLRDQILASKDDTERCLGIQKLFAMPEEVALPTWKQLMLASTLTPEQIQYALAQMKRRDSANVDPVKVELAKSGRLKTAN